MLLTRPAQTLLLIIAMVIVVVVIPGCSPQPVRYVSEPLPLPVRPVLPALSANDLACLSDESYKRLLARDLLRRQYAEEMEAIIRATHTEIDPMASRPPTVKPGPY